MSQALSRSLGTERVQHLAANNSRVSDKDFAPEPETFHFPLPTRSSTLQPALSLAPPLTLPALTRVNLRGYKQPGAPKDHPTFTYLWHVHCIHGKAATWAHSSLEVQEIISSINTYNLTTWIRLLGGYEELEHNPQIWNKVALGMKLIKSEDQDDKHAKLVIEVIQRVAREWLRPFERYCTDWPKISELEKEKLVYSLTKKLEELNPSATQQPFDYGIWPPVSLDPVSPESIACIAVRLCNRSEPGIPADYPTYFYMMELWELSQDRLKVAPPLPRDNNGKALELDCYTFNMEINKLEGGLNGLLRSLSAWGRLAFRMNMIEREDQKDARSRQVITQLLTYVRNYLCHFGKFCDDWVELGKEEKDDMVRRLLLSLCAVVPSMPGSKGKAPKSVPMDRISSVPSISGLQISSPLEQNTQLSVDLYAYDSSEIPYENKMICNFFWSMWFLDTKPPPVPAWKGVRLSIDFRRMRSLIDGLGGSAQMQRFSQLWKEVAYEMKLATRDEQDIEHMKYLVESLQFVEQEWLLPFERFCVGWNTLNPEEKAEHIRRLVGYLRREKPDHPLPLLRPGEMQMIQTDALSAARTLEQRLEGFYPDEPFEERLGRLKMLSIDQAEKYGIKDWITRYQKTPFSEESIKTMAAALAGRPTTSKTIGIPTAGKAGDSWTKILYCEPGEPQLVAEAGLWSSDLAKAANQFVRDTLTKINDSRATSQARIQVPESRRKRLKRVIHEAYPFAFKFYCHAALHYMLYTRGPWTEFLMRQACLVLEQFFFLRAGSSVYIADVKDAQFARGILRDEVHKTQAAYTSKALDHKAGLGTPEKVMSKETPLGTQIGLPSLSAKARVFLG